VPAARDAAADSLVLADGFSSRTQIEQGGTARTPAHLAELLAAGLHAAVRTGLARTGPVGTRPTRTRCRCGRTARAARRR
jgi:hypothetical protein